MKLRPHVTEQTLPLASRQVYTFITEGSYSATQIRKKLVEVFGLHPLSLSVARRAAKRRFARGRLVIRQRARTVAYVRLPKAETVKAFTPAKEGGKS